MTTPTLTYRVQIKMIAARQVEIYSIHGRLSAADIARMAEAKARNEFGEADDVEVEVLDYVEEKRND